MSMLNETLLIAAGLDIYVPPTYIDSTQTQVAGTDVTVTKPTGTGLNDFLFAMCYTVASGRTWTPPSGWTLVASVNATHSIALFKKQATGSEPADYTFALSGVATTKWATVFNYRGATTVSANNLSGATIASADPQVAASMSVVKDRILLAVMGLFSGSATLTSGPSGMTSREQQFSASPMGAVFDLVNPSTGASGTKSFDINTAATGTAFLVEIQ